ncbi:hypothetical protein PVNG_05966 [Plasmodium vivax North Korean]|uniref:Variable surface protein Vir35 n=1 Tax=Plasmodium vivax North Korean TaxID=1035514 RepID=A0A0J9U031_PLAVI|nr:hypothetical protein PVNG_05966 [Plasmodium vivax North Korean]
MVISLNFVIKRKLKIHKLIKIVTLIIFIWIYHTKDDNSNFGNFIGKKNNDVKILDLALHRSLSKHGFNEEPERRKLKERLTYDRDMKSAKTGWDGMSTYKTLKKGEFSQLELYKKNYKKRYTKKKDLKKLDCYWEKKIFDKIEKINVIAGKTQSRKMRFIKKILNKYTILLFLFALLPALGGIIPELFGDKKPSNRFMNVYFRQCKGKSGFYSTCPNKFYHVPPELGNATFYINNTFFFVSIISFISITVYIAVKIIKYQFLKNGLGNITLKEYYGLLKKTF